MERQLVGGATPRVFATNPDDPEEGRIFIWGGHTTRWYEREGGETGAVSFVPVANSEDEFRSWVWGDLDADVTELDDDFAETVREEFLNQRPVLPIEAERSDEETRQGLEPE